MSSIDRRSFLGALALLGCSRRDQAVAEPPAPVAKALPEMPEAGAEPMPRGQVGTQTWTFEGGGRAVVVQPTWIKAGERLPLLIALHGRGEALKGPELGAMGWPKDYALLRAIARLCAPPITPPDLENFVDEKRLAETNRDLAARPWKGLVVLCPYLPDVDLRKPAKIREYGDYLLKSVLPRASRELPIVASPAAIGIDGVSLGGAVALRVGLGAPEAFGAVGTLQAAIGEDQVAELTELAKTARAKNPALALRLLTSKEDYFHNAITKTSAAWRAAGIEHDFADVPGPHDYPFNRGPGAIEMLLWHDRKLARA
ncbi:putative esterase [Labilithrix luteola]|uniref:Putative esterase n=1 Tax=Labilithrix luteola TaxID=1391654 RepID=A0A0K1PQV3_9BACT|nr:esterase [Labilithrix luteola]AKU95907.1 putative esterase [Labilithrix luteola]